MMFDNNPYGAVQYGMMAELHRKVSGELEVPNETAVENRSKLFAPLRQLWVGMWQQIRPFKAGPTGFDDTLCPSVENLERSC